MRSKRPTNSNSFLFWTSASENSLRHVNFVRIFIRHATHKEKIRSVESTEFEHSFWVFFGTARKNHRRKEKRRRWKQRESDVCASETINLLNDLAISHRKGNATTFPRLRNVHTQKNNKNVKKDTIFLRNVWKNINFMFTHTKCNRNKNKKALKNNIFRVLYRRINAFQIKHKIKEKNITQMQCDGFTWTRWNEQKKN